jgi:outer membrane protein assembly factor BamD
VFHFPFVPYKSLNLYTSKKLVFLTCLLTLSACEFGREAYEDRSETELYTMAKKELSGHNYSKAAKIFAEVEQQHPYSNWALRGQIMSAYCYYEAKKYDEAIDGFKVFIQLHPSHEDVAYAYYMIGLCYYEQIPIVERDQQPAIKSTEAFNEVINRFKTSVYAKDAQFKLDLIKDHMAAKELDVGRFYQSKGSYLAALNRFKEVAEKFDTTAQVEESLFRMCECYLSLGLRPEAIAAASVLQHNYPKGQWYKDAYDLLQMPLPLIIPDPKEAKEIEKSGDVLPIEGETAKELDYIVENKELQDRGDPLISEEIHRIEGRHKNAENYPDGDDTTLYKDSIRYPNLGSSDHLDDTSENKNRGIPQN